MDASSSPLHSIAANARALVEIARARGAKHAPSAQRPTTVKPCFAVLPTPDYAGLRTCLSQVHLPAKVIDSAIAAYEKACVRWLSDITYHFDIAAKSVSPANYHLLELLRFQTFTRQVEKWQTQVLEFASRWREEMEKQRAHITATMGPSEKKRRKFHSEYTPLLELYFRFNAYPTWADRRALAEKTGMLTRQITVWFQNHRRRAKGPLPRMSPTDKIPMEQFEREREALARKMLPVLLSPNLRPPAPGNENVNNATPFAVAKMMAQRSKGRSKDNANQSTSQAAKKYAKKAGPSIFPGSLMDVVSECTSPKPKKLKKKKSSAVSTNVPDVEMADGTKVKRRKMKKLPGAANQGGSGAPMDVDGQRKTAPSKKSKQSAFDSANELAFAKAAYPTPSPYAWVHTRKPQDVKQKDVRMRDASKLGKGRPTSAPINPSSASTVPPRRLSSRLNAMRPPYAFPAPYNPATVPMSFSTTRPGQFAFPTDSASFGFATRGPFKRVATYPPIVTLIDLFNRLRLLSTDESPLCDETFVAHERSQVQRLRIEGLTAREASSRKVISDSYAARRAVTYVTPTAPLESMVRDLALAVRSHWIRPLVPSHPIVQPDDFAPFVARAAKRAKRKARKEKKLQEEKQIRKAEKKARKEERKKADLPRHSPSMVDAQDSSSRASVTSDASTPPRKSRKASRKSDKASRTPSVASSARTPSLSSASSRRSSGMSMPGTPRPDQSLPIVASSDFALGGDEDFAMSQDLMAQLFGEDEASSVGQMQTEEFTPDMLTFTSTAGGALSDMTADVNMPGLSNVYVSQQNVDDMGWEASLGLGAPEYAPLGSFGNESNVELNWLLDQNLLGDTQMSDLSYTAPTTSSQINILGSTYQCELGGSDSTTTSFNFNDWTFGLGPCDDGFASFGNNLNLLGGTAVAV
uniref:Y5 n=1 Tax=Schizophyllum commune TaxID=5334 RepID=Q02531_SCHCO|nr:Y5 [Schizophyllum commune]